MVKAGPTDWSKVYWGVRSSSVGHDPRFSEEEFGFQPTWLVFQAYNHAMDKERMRINLESIAISKFAAFYVDSQKDPKRKTKATSPEVFMPFEFTDEIATEDSQPTISIETAIIFNKLIREGKLPNRMVAVAGTLGVLEQVSKLLNL